MRTKPDELESFYFNEIKRILIKADELFEEIDDISDLRINFEGKESFVTALKKIQENDLELMRGYMGHLPRKTEAELADLDEQLNILEARTAILLVDLGCQSQAPRIGGETIAAKPEIPNTPVYNNIVQMIEELTKQVDDTELSDDDTTTQAAITRLGEIQDQGIDIVLELLDQLPGETESDLDIHTEISSRIDSLRAKLKEKLDELGCEPPE
jgi:hypothetical protein